MRFTFGDPLKFTHPTTGLPLSGRYVDTQVQTGELRVTRDDDGSYLWVKPSAVITEHIASHTQVIRHHGTRTYAAR